MRSHYINDFAISVQVVGIFLESVFLSIWSGLLIKSTLHIAQSLSFDKLKVRENIGTSEESAAYWFDSLGESMHDWPVSNEHGDTQEGVGIIVIGAVSEESVTELSFIFSGESWVVIDLLEKFLIR